MASAGNTSVFVHNEYRPFEGKSTWDDSDFKFRFVIKGSGAIQTPNVMYLRERSNIPRLFMSKILFVCLRQKWLSINGEESIYGRVHRLTRAVTRRHVVMDSQFHIRKALLMKKSINISCILEVLTQIFVHSSRWQHINCYVAKCTSNEDRKCYIYPHVLHVCSLLHPSSKLQSSSLEWRRHRPIYSCTWAFDQQDNCFETLWRAKDKLARMLL
jgi:hypothetical protein